MKTSQPLSEATTEEISGFWTLFSRMYRNMDRIRECSNRLIEMADQVDTFDTPENFEESLRGVFDATELKKVFSRIQQEMNSILSYAHEIRPHIKNPQMVDALSKIALALVTQMGFPSHHLGAKVGDISLAIRIFAQQANKLILNPTKKSIKAGFGIDVGVEWARIKASLDRELCNY